MDNNQTAALDPSAGNAGTENAGAQEQPFDEKLCRLILMCQVDSMRAEVHRAQEFQAFQDYAKSLQDQLPPWLPDGYAELKLKALAHDPTIAAAFDYRNVDRQAAGFELARAKLVLAAFQRANDPRVDQVAEYINKLNIAVNSSAILRQARLNIINEANKLPPPLDQEATELKADIAWNMKTQGGKRVPEPPPNYGRLSDREFRQEVTINLGLIR